MNSEQSKLLTRLMPPRIAIAARKSAAISETFIVAHIERLPNVCGVIHREGLIPVIDGRPALSQSLPARAIRKIARKLHGRDWSWELTAGNIAAMRRLKADVVLAEYGPTGVGVMEACALAEVPLVVVFHGYDASKRQVIEQNQDQYHTLFQHAAAVVAVSNAMASALQQLSCPAEKIVVAPCGCDVDQFRSAFPDAAPPVFLAVGRLVDKKAPHLLLLAFAEVCKECPDARLRMIGDGYLRGVCDDIILAYGLERSVDMLGACDHATVAREMQSARAFVQHSVVAASGDSEGTPVAVLEAGACGLPVVSTRHAGIPDVVLHGETGLLVDERDVRGMADHMIQLVKNPALAAELGCNARQHVLSRYTMDHSIDRLSRVLQAAALGESILGVKESIEGELIEGLSATATA